MSSLLEPSFLRRLEVLRHHLLAEARSRAPADQLSRRRGASSEFREHRAYAPGDDLRRVDWMAYARTGEPVIKLFHAEEDTLVRVLVDASASLRFGSPPKLDVLKRVAAAIAYLALTSSRRAQILIAPRAAEQPESFVVGPLHRGRPGFSEICRELEAVEAKGQTSLAASIDVLTRRFPIPGLLVVLSDFLDPSDVPLALRRARAAGNDIVIIQILDPTELSPELEGDLALEDAETGEVIEVSIDPEALEAYTLRLAKLFEELRAWARKYGGTYVRMHTTDDLESTVRRVLSRCVD